MVWLPLQECTECLESTLRAGGTTIEDIILNLVSVNYIELLMAASGSAANDALDQTNKQPHVLVVNGSVPLGAGGAYTVIGGKSARQVLEESAANATSIWQWAPARWGGRCRPRVPIRPAPSASTRSSPTSRCGTSPGARRSVR